jgi:hypothetical protein
MNLPAGASGKKPLICKSISGPSTGSFRSTPWPHVSRPALKFRDWTQLKRAEVSPKEAKAILAAINTEKMKIDPEAFRKGMEVELEHGIRFKDANVTNNHPILTGMIVLAHLKESLDYYKLLEVAELEGDLLKAVAAGNIKKIRTEYKKLAEAKIILAKAEAARIS